VELEANSSFLYLTLTIALDNTRNA